MSEIFLIFLSVSFFVSIFFIPYNQVINFDKKIIKNLYPFLSENLIIIFNFLLLLTFFNLRLSNIFVIFLLASIMLLILFRKIFFKINKFKIVLTFFIFLVFLFSLDLSYNLTLYWDGQTMWLPKTIMFYENDVISDLKNFLRPEYPYLGSLIWAFFWKLSFLEYEYFGRISFIICFCLSIVNLLELLKLKRVDHLSLSLIFILLIYTYWHFRGTQEILIFSFLLFSVKYLYLIIVENDLKIKNLIYFILSINLIIWTKNEGLFFSIFLFISYLLFSKYQLKTRFFSSIIFLLLILLRFTIYKFYNLNVGLSPDFQLNEIFNLLITNINLNNILFIFKHIFYSIIKFPFILLSLLIFLFSIFEKKDIQKFRFVFVYLFLSISFIIFIYFSSIKNLEFMVITGLNRLVFESFAPILILTFPYVKSIYRK